MRIERQCARVRKDRKMTYQEEEGWPQSSGVLVGPCLRRKNVQSVTRNKWVDEFDKNLLLRCNQICIISQNQLCQVQHCKIVREVGWSNSIN